MNSYTANQIEWAKLDQPTFDRFVEVLLIRHHGLKEPEVDVTALDGRGGDGGRDVDVSVDGRVRHIYQLKFFPEGFSGAWAKARKPQIAKSFTSAMKHKPEVWTLVIPRNPTTGEVDYVRSLKKDQKVKIRVLGQAHLDAMMTELPDVRDWALREPLKDVLRSISLERSGLGSPQDLQDAALSLHEVATSRSPHWGTSFSVQDGVYVEEYHPKHARAQELEPLGLKRFGIRVPKTDAEMLQRVSRVLGYGDDQRLTLTGEYLHGVEFQGPAWANLPGPLDSPVLELRPHEAVRPNVSVEVQILDPDDYEAVVQSFIGETTYIGGGTDGATFKIRMRGGAKLNLYSAFEGTDPRGVGDQVDISHSVVGLNAIDALEGLALMAQLFDRKPARLLVGEQVVSVLKLDKDRAGRQPDGEKYVAGYMPDIVSDLATIQRLSGVVLQVPREVSARDRLVMRVVRLLLEGHAVIHPFIESLTFEPDPEVAWQEIASHPSMLKQKRLTVEVAGKKLSLGLAFYVVLDPQVLPLLGPLREGESRSVQLKTLPNEGVKILLPERAAATEGELLVTPWGLDGYSEHHELRGTTPPPLSA